MPENGAARHSVDFIITNFIEYIADLSSATVITHVNQLCYTYILSKVGQNFKLIRFD